jgi:Uma2 family endonuclease
MGLLKIEEIPVYGYEDYKRWEGRWELINGVAYAMSPAPSIKHQKVSDNIAWQLNQLLRDCKKCFSLLPVDWKIDENTIVQPDNLVICYEPEKEEYITKAPTLIFEILSKSTVMKDTKIKYELYEKEGVNHYVIVDPSEKVAKVFKLKNGRYEKIKDAQNEKIKMDLKECEVEFDFSLIWA